VWEHRADKAALGQGIGKRYNPWRCKGGDGGAVIGMSAIAGKEFESIRTKDSISHHFRAPWVCGCIVTLNIAFFSSDFTCESMGIVLHEVCRSPK
jgi:hypothetical protein